MQVDIKLNLIFPRRSEIPSTTLKVNPAYFFVESEAQLFGINISSGL